MLCGLVEPNMVHETAGPVWSPIQVFDLTTFSEITFLDGEMQDKKSSHVSRFLFK